MSKISFRKCPSCRSLVPVSAQQCPKCGGILPEIKDLGKSTPKGMSETAFDGLVFFIAVFIGVGIGFFLITRFLK